MPLFGRQLVEDNFITDEQLEVALSSQKKLRRKLGEAAVALGFINEAELAKSLSKTLNLPYMDLDHLDEISNDVIEKVPVTVARRHTVMPIRRENDTLIIAVADPHDIRMLDAVRSASGCTIKKVIATKAGILNAIEAHYNAPSRLAKSMELLLEDNGLMVKDAIAFDTAGKSTLINQLTNEASDAPVVRFVNLMLMRAVQERASDIHVEPLEGTVSVRYRIDGLLANTIAPPHTLVNAIVTRIKLLSRLDITERRLPQDGSFKFTVFGKSIDVRVSCLPTIHGEKVVLRLLDQSGVILDMQQLGFDDQMIQAFMRIIHLPHGLVLITGPTGSGKTTTLHCALNTLKGPSKNITTIEDPVEYQIPGINQVNIKPEIGLTFPSCLRAILRQDPDIIMLGEMRDLETAEICIRSSLTGHLVFSTLHTNNAISAVSRLIDMGLEPFLLSATLNLVMAQRLVRRVCNSCAETVELPKGFKEKIQKYLGDNRDPWNVRKGAGCKHCSQTGYRGRAAVYEQFVITDRMGTEIAHYKDDGRLFDMARQDGMKTLLENALLKVKTGITTLDEALSVCAEAGETSIWMNS